jgi:hypothetical protein
MRLAEPLAEHADAQPIDTMPTASQRLSEGADSESKSTP